MTSTKRSIIIVFGAYIIALFFARQFEHSATYFPKPGFDESLISEYDLKQVWIDDIHAIYSNIGGDTIDLFFHGNAGNINTNEPNIAYLKEAQVSFLMIDYPGYGLSKGSPSEEALYSSAQSAYDWLIEQGWKSNQIVINGQSLGGAVAADLASKNTCKSLILEATFPSTYDVADLHYPWLPKKILVPNRFITKEKIQKVSCPILILHGDRDDLLPYAFAEELYKLAPEPKYILTLEDLGHNDVQEYGKMTEQKEKINEFLKTAAIQ